MKGGGHLISKFRSPLQKEYPESYEALLQFYSIDKRNKDILSFRLLYQLCEYTKKEVNLLTAQDIYSFFEFLKEHMIRNGGSFSSSTYRRYFYSIRTLLFHIYGVEKGEELFSLMEEENIEQYKKNVIIFIPTDEEINNILDYFQTSPCLHMILLLSIYAGVSYTDAICLLPSDMRIEDSSIYISFHKQNYVVELSDMLYNKMVTYLEKEKEGIRKSGYVFFTAQKKMIPARSLRYHLKNGMDELFSKGKVMKVYTFSDLKDYYCFLHMNDFEKLRKNTGLSVHHLKSKQGRLRQMNDK